MVLLRYKYFESRAVFQYIDFMNKFHADIIRLFRAIHPLDRIPRAGFLLNGITEPESVASHSHFLSLLALLFLDKFPGKWDKEKVLTLCLIHDLPEVFSMDIPMPFGDKHFSNSKKNMELTGCKTLLDPFSKNYCEAYKELLEGKTPEARVVHGLDKAQMMLKILNYDREKRGNLSEFWENENNFNDRDIPEIRELFNLIRKEKYE